MARGNLPACLAVTLPHEGGWADHPADPGGATMKGITLATFRQWVANATKTQLRNISDDMVEKIYRTGYWNKVRGEDLPFGVDLAVFDFGVNSGPSRAAKYLQAVVGVTQDGHVGPKTIAATQRLDGKVVVQKVCARRLSFVRGLGTFKVFGKGWSRRIADVEAKGVAMFLAKGFGTSPGATGRELAREGEKAGATASTQNKTAGGVAGAGGTGGVGVAASGDPNWWIVGGVVLALLVVAALIALRARQNKDRAEAYDREAKAVTAAAL